MRFSGRRPLCANSQMSDTVDRTTPQRNRVRLISRPQGKGTTTPIEGTKHYAAIAAPVPKVSDKNASFYRLFQSGSFATTASGSMRAAFRAALHRNRARSSITLPCRVLVEIMWFSCDARRILMPHNRWLCSIKWPNYLSCTPASDRDESRPYPFYPGYNLPPDNRPVGLPLR